jgi:hypothetical protein
MKKAFLSLSAISLLILGTVCISAQETRELKPFTGIGIGIDADVYYARGNSHRITIEGNRDDVKDLITEVKDGVLKLRYEDWRVRHSKLTIHITSPELEEISLSGSAKFQVEETLKSDELSISISGSGSVMLSALEGDELEVKISGSGNAMIDKGKADEMDVKISGSGKLMAEYFEVSEFSAAISGSGSCRITVTDELEARISGSGSVYYHGNPQVNSTSSGSGKVRSL